MTPVFRYGDHLIHIDGKRQIHLAAQEADLLAVLAKNHGRVVSTATVLTSLWPVDADEPGDPNNTMRQVLHRLREKLEGTGLQIETVRELGMKLVGEITTDWSVR